MNLDIAHIEALKRGGARFNDKMTDRERNSFWNLLLLCRPHHRHVDEDEERYKVPILKDWKRQAEVDIDQAELEVFRGVTEGRFEGIIRGVIQQHAIEVRTALDELKDLGHEHTGLLNDVLARLDDPQIAGGYIDADQVTLLNGAAAKLERSLNVDTVNLLYRASREIARTLNPDVVIQFYQAARAMQRLSTTFEQVGRLERVANSKVLANLPDLISRLERLLQRMPRDY